MALGTSPDPINTFIGAGIVKWKGSADSDYRDLGECSQFQVTGTVSRKEFWTKRTGIRRKARSVVLEESLTVNMKLEEITADNLALFLMGSVVEGGGSPASPTQVNIMDIGEVSGALRFIGTTDIGEKMQVDIPNVNISPAAAFDFLGDDWGGLEIMAEAVADPSTNSFGMVRTPITSELLS